MRTKLLRSAVLFLILIFFNSAGELFSQTPGTLSFTVTTTAPDAGYGADNLLAIWIQSSTSALPADFVKTKIKYASTSDANSHLPTWTTVSGRNVTDAVSGASRNSHGTVTFLWNGTNVPGTLVADATYYIRTEMAWGDNDDALSSYSFSKGPTLFHSNPVNTANFLNVGITWTPLATGIERALESKDFNIYPNPSTGLLNIDFKNSGEECTLQIINESGQVVYKEKISDFDIGVRTFDLTRLSAGVYYSTLHFPGRDVVFTLIMVK